LRKKIQEKYLDLRVSDAGALLAMRFWYPWVEPYKWINGIWIFIPRSGKGFRIFPCACVRRREDPLPLQYAIHSGKHEKSPVLQRHGSLSAGGIFISLNAVLLFCTLNRRIFVGNRTTFVPRH
jgi:hypothetical protein